MNEQQKWQDWKPEDEDLNKLLRPGSIQRLQPGHPLVKLTKSLRLNMIWGGIIMSFYLSVIFFFPYWPVVLAMLVTLIFSLYVFRGAWRLYRSIQTTTQSATRPLLQELKVHYMEIREWGRVQQKLGIFVYPFAAAGGYISGGLLGSGMSMDVLLQKPTFIYVLPITIIVLVPLGYWLSKWLFKKSFGKLLIQLKGIIESLEKEY